MNARSLVSQARSLISVLGLRSAASHIASLFFDRRKPAALAIGLCRIALAVAMLWTLQKHAEVFGTYGGIEGFAKAMAGIDFHAFGILRPFFSDTPSPEFVGTVWNIAIVSCVFSLVGFMSRPSTIVAVLSLLIITTFREGTYPYWSHGYLVVMVAGLAFMFGQSGASLSVDWVLARFIRRYPFKAQTILGYWWPVAAGQAAIALFYFGAGIAKHLNGGILPWVMSDNLRFSLAVTWYGYERFDIPWYVQTLMNTQWLWIAAAAGHVFTQFYPMLAVFHKNHPIFRLSEGVVYVGGVFLLYFAMTVWNPVWLPLAAFFIDWDWVAQKFRRKRVAAPPAAPEAAAPAPATSPTALSTGEEDAAAPTAKKTWAARIVGGYLCAFFGFYIITFTFQLGHWHLLYPFSSLDFYSNVKAKQPYDKHLPYDFYRGHVAVRLETCSPTNEDWAAAGFSANEFRRASVQETCKDGWYRYPNITSTYPEFYRATSADSMKGSLEVTRDYLNKDGGYFVPGIKEVVIEKAIWVYPAYPNPVEPIPVHYGARGYLDVASNHMRYVDSKFYRDTDTQEYRIEWDIVGFEDPVVESLVYRSNVRNESEVQPLRPLAGKWTSPTRFVVDESVSPWADGPGFSLIYIRDRKDPEGRIWEFWGPDNLS